MHPPGPCCFVSFRLVQTPQPPSGCHLAAASPPSDHSAVELSRADWLQDAHALARAVKEHERRAGHTLGFVGEEPGDCLAFKYYREVSFG